MNITVEFRHKLTSRSMGSISVPVPKGYEVESIILPDGVKFRDEFSFDIPNQLVGVELTFGLRLISSVPRQER